jgi:hypothetical protein
MCGNKTEKCLGVCVQVFEITTKLNYLHWLWKPSIDGPLYTHEFYNDTKFLNSFVELKLCDQRKYHCLIFSIQVPNGDLVWQNNFEEVIWFPDKQLLTTVSQVGGH